MASFSSEKVIRKNSYNKPGLVKEKKKIKRKLKANQNKTPANSDATKIKVDV